MNKLFFTLLLLGASISLSAQNTTVEQEVLYYIKKAYQHRKDTDKTTALKYLKTFEDYLSANLKPENVGDSTALVYSETLIALSSSKIDTNELEKAYNFLILKAEKGLKEAQFIVSVYYRKK